MSSSLLLQHFSSESGEKTEGCFDEAWFPEEMKKNFKKAIVTEIMSSEDET